MVSVIKHYLGGDWDTSGVGQSRGQQSKKKGEIAKITITLRKKEITDNKKQGSWCKSGKPLISAKHDAKEIRLAEKKKKGESRRNR